MGSGLILLIIVGAWLAVLVPMALRSHDAATSSRSVERFSDAMRVLARRTRTSRGVETADDGAYDEDEDYDDLDGELGLDGPDNDPPRPRLLPPLRIPRQLPAVAGRYLPSLSLSRLRRRRPRPALTPAARRRRALLVLVTLAAATGAGAFFGPPWVLGVHLVADALLIAFLVVLRRQVLAREERHWAEQRRAARVPARAATGTVVVRGIPDRMPPRVAVPAAVAPEQRRPATALGEPWEPVPVPIPTYVTAPVAPSPYDDLPAAGTAVARADDEAALLADDGELDDILERRHAVGGW